MTQTAPDNRIAASRRPCRLCLTALVLAATQAVGLAAEPFAAQDGFAAPAINEVHPVAARLLADRTAAVPGGRIRLGVLLEMQPGWHVYWKNPGDAGLATEVAWKLPPGFVAGPLQWPVPVRFDQEGGIAGYGYTGQVLHWAEITVPADLPPGKPVRLAVEADWLACKSKCVPGRAGLAITLGVARQSGPDNAEVFDAWRRRLPAIAGAGPQAPGARVAGADGITTNWSTLTIDVAWPAAAPAKLEWFPPPVDVLEFRRPVIASSDGKTRIRLPVRLLDGNRLPPGDLEALLAWPDGAARRGLAIRIRLAPAPANSAGGRPLAVGDRPGGK